MLELGFGHEFSMTHSEAKTYVNEKILEGDQKSPFIGVIHHSDPEEMALLLASCPDEETEAWGDYPTTKW